ncbi:MFS general substrate transporter [Aulographum hederae CBS 113979]|uniref:MFS general substrate transporter n=1 Tax=Aulographum hederae CBS 113979 TaxID=1176131 RepID=A0A6G1HE28_9PEZI|nr:MFS general substrate transporter [Aulographum hederae CBS 113979]
MSTLQQPAPSSNNQLPERELADGDYQASHSKTSSVTQDQGADAEKNIPPVSQSSDGPPDGGTVAWLVVFGAWCTSFCSFGWLNSVGVFQEFYQNDLLSQYSSSTISWIPSLQIFFMLGMGPVVGEIYDHYGPRWFLLGGTFLHVFGIMMASISTKYYQILLSQGICSGIGAAAIFQPAVTCVAGWFNANRGAAFGALFTGSSIGGIVFPIMVTHLIRLVGFGWAMRTCAFLILALLIIANLTIRPYQPPVPRKTTFVQLAKPFTESQFILVLLGFFCFSYGFFAPINYLPVQALSAGMSANLAQYILTILNAGSLFGRLFSGFAGDKIGRYNIFIVVCYLSGILILGLWLTDHSNAGIIAFAVLFGFFSGAYVSLITALVMAISPMKELGFRTGIVMFVTSLGGLTTSPINGAIVDSNGGGYSGLMIFSGVFCLVGTTLILVARMRMAGWKIIAVY